MDQIVQVLGSLLILSAFVAAQRGWLSTQSRLYVTLNLLGASVLTVLAAHDAWWASCCWSSSGRLWPHTRWSVHFDFEHAGAGCIKSVGPRLSRRRADRGRCGR